MEDKEVMKRLKGLFEQKTGIKIDRTLRKLNIFRDGDDVIVPLSKNYGVVLWDLEEVEDHREMVERHFEMEGEKGYTKEGLAKAKFLLSGKYRDYVVEIRGEKYVPWYFVSLNYSRGRLEGFMDIYYHKIKSIYGWKYS